MRRGNNFGTFKSNSNINNYRSDHREESLKHYKNIRWTMYVGSQLEYSDPLI